MSFTSSEIYKLIPEGRAKDARFSQSGLTYIKQVRYKIKLHRSIRGEVFSYPTSWGWFVERYVNDLIGIPWQLVSSGNRFVHPELPWSGVPDLLKTNEVGDIKSPYTLEAFCDMNEIDSIEYFRKNKPEYYWQLISNAVLTRREVCHLWAFVPNEQQLQEIMELASQEDEYSWISQNKNRLPYLVAKSEYDPLFHFEFKAPKEDVELLTEKVTLAKELL